MTPTTSTAGAIALEPQQLPAGGAKGSQGSLPVAAPAVEDSQAIAALALANEARAAHTGLRTRLGARDRSTSYQAAAVVVLNPGRHLRGMRLGYLLRSIKSIGPVKAVRICRRARVSELARLRDLTDQQRHTIANELRRAAR
jgi:hypothetical protein